MEDWSAPKQAWDWREFSTAYGPFGSEEEAYEHLRNSHANPGGHSVTRNDVYVEDETYRKFFNEAAERTAKESSRYGSGRWW